MRRLVSCALILSLALAFFISDTNHPSASAQAAISARVLVWEATPNDDGQLEVLTSDGNIEVVVDFPAGQFANVAKWCGHDYWTSNGQAVAVYTGAAQGDITIYPVAGGTPIALGKANRMACSGPMSFQFSPNGQRAGFIDYLPESIDQEFPYGNLIIVDATTGASLATFDWTTAFALYDNAALMLRFYPDGEGNATEADLVWWDGSAQQILATLEPVFPVDQPDVECGLKSGAVARVGDNVFVLVGQRCETGAASWRLLQVPMGGGAATEIASGQPAGGFFTESFTTQLIPTKDNSGFLITIPSGLGRNTVTLAWVTPEGAMTSLLEGQHVIADRFGERLSEGRHLLLSPDGNSLAFVTSTGDNIQTLWMLDMSTVGGVPLSIQEEGVNERIFQYVWASNNRLYYAAGAIESNSLNVVAPGEAPQRLARGRFYRLAVNFAGDKIAATEWVANPERVGDDLSRLVVLDTAGKSATIKDGDQSHNEFTPLAIQ